MDDQSNEITAVLQLLETLEVAGCIVTTDAMNCQTETAEKVIENDADYVFVVKENQTRLLEAIQGVFDDPDEMRWVDCDYERTLDGNHGCVETRKCWTTSDPEELTNIASFAGWPGLQSIRMIEAKRRHVISSLASNADGTTTACSRSCRLNAIALSEALRALDKSPDLGIIWPN